MTLPGQTITVNDPGLGIVEPATTTELALGTCESGTVSTLYTFSNKPSAVATLGQGPLTEHVCRTLDVGGGPVLAMRLTGSVAGAAGAVTKTPVAGGAPSTGTITVAGAAFDAYQAVIEILTNNTAAAAGSFHYSLDEGRTYSDEIVIPAGLTYAIPSTNLTLTFVPGAGPIFYEAGDQHTFDCTAPDFAVVDLAAAVTAILALPANTKFDFVSLCGKQATAAAAATMFAAVETHAATLAGVFQYQGWIMDLGDDTIANVKTSMAAVDDTRIMGCYGDYDGYSAKPMAGWYWPRRPLVDWAAGEAARRLMSTDLGRVASGPGFGVRAISHDEYQNEQLDVDRITTSRTFAGRSGFYLTNGRIKSAPGSDFVYWQHRRIMDVACSIIHTTQQLFIGIGVRTNADGTIDERDAARLETRGEAALNVALLQPKNAEGTQGHVSALMYRIDRTNNVALTQEILAQVAIRPLGYVKFITTTIGYSLETGEQVEQVEEGV